MSNVFLAHKTKSEDQSSVWFHFLVHIKEKAIKCKKYGAILKTKGDSTKGLVTHLKSHNIKLFRTSEPMEDVPNKILKKASFMTSKDQTFAVVLARLTAQDGLSFSAIVKSLELRQSLEAGVFQVPKHAYTVKHPHDARVSGVVEGTPGRLEYEVAYYKEAPPITRTSGTNTQISSTKEPPVISELPVDQAVPIGTKLQLRARISTQSVWKYVKLMEVKVTLVAL